MQIKRLGGLIAATLALISVAVQPAASQSYGTVPSMPQGSDPRLNPTGPSPTLPPGAVAPMPSGRDYRLNPTGPQAGAPPGYIYPMPGGRGRLNPTGPSPQRATESEIPDTRPRRGPSYGYSGGRPEVAPGLQNCLDGWNAKRGLSKKEHRALCNRIWKNKKADDD